MIDVLFHLLVIFIAYLYWDNGGKTKKPATQGEVSIYFCNKSRIFPGDEDEIKI